MNLVQIDAPETLLTGGDVPRTEGLNLAGHGSSRLENGRWRIAGYATDEAISTLEANGCTVTVILNNEQLRQHEETVFRQVNDNEDIPIS